MATQLHSLQRDLAKFFGGKAQQRPGKQYGFRVGASGTPDHEAELHGPFASRAEAQEAADAFNATVPASHNAPYAWAIEPWR